MLNYGTAVFNGPNQGHFVPSAQCLYDISKTGWRALTNNDLTINKSSSSVTTYHPSSTGINNPLPSGIVGDTVTITGIALAANTGRTYLFVQNTSASVPLYVALNRSASTTTYNIILNSAGTSGNGGGSWEDEGRFLGTLYVSGASFVAWEL